MVLITLCQILMVFRGFGKITSQEIQDGESNMAAVWKS